MNDDYRDWDYADQQDEKKDRNAVIDECIAAVETLTLEHKAMAKDFQKKFKTSKNQQHNIAAATYGMLSVYSMRIEDVLRKLKG